MTGPDKKDTTRKILSSPLLRRASKPEVQKKIIQIKAMDFTVLNGAKFGFGLCLGVLTFVLALKGAELFIWTLNGMIGG
jgi:hypothetical protein